MEERQKREIYDLYEECFPGLVMEYESFCGKLGLYREENAPVAFFRREEDILIGVCLVSPGAVTLLCVSPEFRGRGIGSALLAQGEKWQRKQGETQVVLGQGRDYLFQGVPFREGQDSRSFFQKRGYEAAWVSQDLTLCPQRGERLIPAKDCPQEIGFRWAGAEDRGSLLRAVAQVDSSWVCYFEEPEIPVFLAYSRETEGEQLAGFAIVEETKSVFSREMGERMGSVGCVGVTPEYRCRGIGLKLVENATAHLLEQGCREIYIAYTHLADWYARLGFRKRMEFWMGEKSETTSSY